MTSESATVHDTSGGAAGDASFHYQMPEGSDHWSFAWRTFIGSSVIGNARQSGQRSSLKTAD